MASRVAQLAFFKGSFQKRSFAVEKEMNTASALHCAARSLCHVAVQRPLVLSDVGVACDAGL